MFDKDHCAYQDRQIERLEKSLSDVIERIELLQNYLQINVVTTELSSKDSWFGQIFKKEYKPIAKTNNKRGK